MKRAAIGVFGISREAVDPFSEEDICFLRLVGRVVAFALDDGLNLRRAQDAQACLQNQNDRLQLLLNLTNRITSNLQLREVLRDVAANIREVMQCEFHGRNLPVDDNCADPNNMSLVSCHFSVICVRHFQLSTLLISFTVSYSIT